MLNFIFNSFQFDCASQDWWNSTSYANYYRTWNVVVHDWLYYYVYRDFLWVSVFLLIQFFKPTKTARMFLIFIVAFLFVVF